MKKAILAAAASTLAVVGLVSACGHASEPGAMPSADPFPRESQCQDIARPADPHNLIGDNWVTDDACNILNLDHAGPGVDADQAAKIVYDARMKALLGKRDIATLAVEANKQADRPMGVVTDFASVIAQRYSTVKDELNDSRAALAGHAPAGYRIDILRGDAPSASPAWKGQGR